MIYIFRLCSWFLPTSREYLHGNKCCEIELLQFWKSFCGSLFEGPKNASLPNEAQMKGHLKHENSARVPFPIEKR